jgi:pimeloyl-ACP methyl ester carboxylesterase
MLDQLRLRQVDLVGCGRGALVAFELAATRGDAVRRIVTAGSQQPTGPVIQPALQLSPDPGCILEDPVAVADEIRAFLDRP